MADLKSLTSYIPQHATSHKHKMGKKQALYRILIDFLTMDVVFLFVYGSNIASFKKLMIFFIQFPTSKIGNMFPCLSEWS